jgi:hypothetical protein
MTVTFNIGANGRVSEMVVRQGTNERTLQKIR